MPYNRITFVLLSLAAALAVPAMAHDLNPPDWRGEPHSALAHWEDGDLGLTLTEFEWVEGVYPLHESEPVLHFGESDDGNVLIDLDIPNFVDDLSKKWVRVQINWEGLADIPPSIVDVSGEDGATGERVTWELEYSSPVQPWTQPDGGYQYHDLLLEPNPDWEMIQITAPPDVIVDQIVVDTISIPEPATMGLLGVGALALVKRRR